jgi:hypothetical protein
MVSSELWRNQRLLCKLEDIGSLEKEEWTFEISDVEKDCRE